jgi:hypothetical protein
LLDVCCGRGYAAIMTNRTENGSGGDRDAKRLGRKIGQFADQLPTGAGNFVRWLTGPSSRVVRIPLALLLIGAGLVGFLPVLGFWMIPLGLLLLAQDVPFIQRPILRLVSWAERKWRARRRR